MYAIIHGSYRKDLDLIQQIADLFRLAGVNVLCPPRLQVNYSDDDFVRFNQFEYDAKKTEQALLAQMQAIVDYGFSYFVNPNKKLGSSSSYELAHAKNLGLPVFLYRPIPDLPVGDFSSQVWQPYDLAFYLLNKNRLPPSA